jgi:hypothetical protein
MRKYEIPAGFAKGRFVPDITIELEEESADRVYGIRSSRFAGAPLNKKPSIGLGRRSI